MSFPTGQTVTQCSISDKNEVFRIGNYSYEDNENEILCFPESTFIKNNDLFIPNMGNGKLLKVDLTPKEIKLITTFEENIWQYLETEIGKFIVTGNGIFEIED